jgi:hypothetical protein
MTSSRWQQQPTNGVPFTDGPTEGISYPTDVQVRFGIPVTARLHWPDGTVESVEGLAKCWTAEVVAVQIARRTWWLPSGDVQRVDYSPS